MKTRTVTAMLMKLPVLLLLMSPLTVRAMPIDHGFYTTSGGLEWLDVTITRDKSFNEVSALLGDATFVAQYGSGWRHATGHEFDALMLDFGFIPSNATCDGGYIFCDIYPGEAGSLINTAIEMLGDTRVAAYKADNPANPSVEGFGFTYGLLADVRDATSVWAATVWDAEVTDNNGNAINLDDRVYTHHGWWPINSNISTVGSYLVRDSVSVPEPVSATLFALGLLGLGIVKRRIIGLR